MVAFLRDGTATALGLGDGPVPADGACGGGFQANGFEGFTGGRGATPPNPPDGDPAPDGCGAAPEGVRTGPAPSGSYWVRRLALGAGGGAGRPPSMGWPQIKQKALPGGFSAPHLGLLQIKCRPPVWRHDTPGSDRAVSHGYVVPGDVIRGASRW